MSAQLTPAAAPRNAAEFMLANGRLPMLGDEVPPWEYSGWLLFYVQGAEMVIQGENSRWLHYLKTREAGRLLDEPIPPLQFGHTGHCADEGSPGHKALEKWVEIANQDLGWGSGFRAFLDWMLWGLGLAKEAPRISAKTNERLYREVQIQILLQHPYDYFGGYYARSKTNKFNSTAFYPTPHEIVELMARMQGWDCDRETNGRDRRTLTVCDPCVGTGRMLLHAASYSYCLYGMDIDPVCVAATKINGALYAPWLTWPLPDSITGVHRPEIPDSPVEIEDALSPLVQPAALELVPAAKPKAKKARTDEQQMRLF